MAVAVSVETLANVELVVLAFDNDTPPTELYQFAKTLDVRQLVAVYHNGELR